jgi:diguanylate cyclase (GGDEF)-like protein
LSTILVIDASEAQRAEARATLEASRSFHRILEAADGLEGLRLLLAHPVDVVLADLEMPKLDGDKLLRMKASSPGGPHIPFIFLTAPGDEARRARLLSQGASDAIDKPFHGPELVARLRLHLKVKKLQDELVLKNESLSRLSTIDVVTGLRTRRFADEVLHVEFLRARRYRNPLSVVMADLDHFKQVNDRFGHLAGDAVLRGVAGVIDGLVRATDVAARFGGEEMIMIQPQNDAGGASVMAERVRAEVEAARFEVEGESIGVTVSVGVAQFHPDMDSPRVLVGLADRALYRAKEAGRNQVAIEY